MTKELLKSQISFHYIPVFKRSGKEKQLEVIPADVVTIKNNKSALEKICDTLTKDFEKFISCSILCCVTRSRFISSSITVFGRNFRVCYQYSKLPPDIVRYL